MGSSVPEARGRDQRSRSVIRPSRIFISQLKTQLATPCCHTEMDVLLMTFPRPCTYLAAVCSSSLETSEEGC